MRFAFEEKAAEAQGVVKEEGSSPTPKKNAADVNAIVEDQNFITPSTQPEILSNEPAKPGSIEVEESMLERGLEEESIPEIED